MKRILFLTFLLAMFALPALAQTTEPTYPAFDLHRLSIAAGVDYAWYAHNSLNPDTKEFKYGVFSAYVLGRNLSAVGSVQYGNDTHILEEKVGLRLMAFNGAKWGH